MTPPAGGPVLPGAVRAAAAAAALLAPVVLAGCGGPVPIDPDPVPPAQAAACEEFAADLPDRLVDLPRVESEPADAPGGAYGDPAVVVTCGVEPPEGLDEFSACEEADGIGWYVPAEAYEQPTEDVTLTTIGVEPPVRLDVPGEERPPAGYLAALAPLVREHLRVVDPCV